MFSLREFIKKGLLDAVGKMADYQIILNAGGWYNQNVLLAEDLAEIQARIDEKNNPVVEETAESAENNENPAENPAENEEPLSEDEGSFNAQENPVETGAEE